MDASIPVLKILTFHAQLLLLCKKSCNFHPRCKDKIIFVSGIHEKNLKSHHPFYKCQFFCFVSRWSEYVSFHKDSRIQNHSINQRLQYFLRLSPHNDILAYAICNTLIHHSALSALIVTRN